MTKTFAIAHPDWPKTVSLWCGDEGKMKDGSRKFRVINGAWIGYLYPDNTLLVEATGTRTPAIVVWEGVVPKRAQYGQVGSNDDHYINGYNQAIRWIEEQIQ